jgi:type I restriction enzyme S subunit
MVPLGEVLREVSEAHRVDADKDYPNFGIYSFGRGLFRKAPISGTTTSARSLFRARRSQFIYSRLFAFEGAYGVVSDEFDGSFVSNEYPMFETDATRLVPEYLTAYFRRPAVWEEVAKGAVGMGDRRRRVQPEHLLRHPIPLPPLPEQRRIVAKLDQLSAKVEEARALVQHAQRAAQSFVAAYHSSLAGNRVVRLGQLLDLSENAIPVSPTTPYPQVGVRSFGAGLFPKTAIQGTDTTYRIFNRLYTGAVVLSQVKGWEGAISVCPAELDGWYVSPEYRTFRCRPGEAEAEYVRPIVSTEWFWSRLQHATRGVGARRERTRPEQFLDLEVPWPELQQQRMAIPALTLMERSKPLHAHSAAELDALMPATLDRAFKGEL